MHWRDSQSMVIYIKFFDLKIVDASFVVEFRESIGDVIPTVITLLRSWESDMGANSLKILSEQGKVSTFLT